MLINGNTKISQLLKENSAALDAITSLAKPLEKLRNPILRKLMASRTTIQQAADISGCRVEAFFLVLRPLGFESSDAPVMKDIAPDQPATRPDWLAALAAQQITVFDVRKMLSSGYDPLKEILAEYKKVRPGAALQIINTFIPTPLLRLLEDKGAQTYSETIAQRLTYSYFFKPVQANDNKNATAQVKLDDLISTVNETGFNAQLGRYTADQIKEIDVRTLEAPAPMQTILKELEALSEEHGLYVHHKRIPVYLLEDLQASGKYCVFILPITEAQVDLLLTHNSKIKRGKD